MLLFQTGPPQYRSRTVFEDATPQMVRDFFWDDEFRQKWDDMLIRAQTLEDCHTTGAMTVHWVRKVSEVCFFYFCLWFCQNFILIGLCSFLSSVAIVNT